MPESICIQAIVTWRLLLVRQRTAHILSLQSMVCRCSGQRISANPIKQLTPADTAALFSDSQLGFTARCHVETIGLAYALPQPTSSISAS